MSVAKSAFGHRFSCGEHVIVKGWERPPGYYWAVILLVDCTGEKPRYLTNDYPHPIKSGGGWFRVPKGLTPCGTNLHWGRWYDESELRPMTAEFRRERTNRRRRLKRRLASRTKGVTPCP